ncbi:MAG: response regulator [Bacteroidota bacterium]|nr:response regulator [Bacteroidota bacterium]
MKAEFSFIIIDDSELDCYVTKKFLERTNKNFIIEIFHNAEHALDIIRNNYSLEEDLPTIILLDLQMPMMNGFKFVEEFEKLSPEIQQNYIIIILTVLTPSRDPNDLYRIFTYRKVNSIVEKPLTKDKLNSLLNEVRMGSIK